MSLSNATLDDPRLAVLAASEELAAADAAARPAVGRKPSTLGASLGVLGAAVLGASAFLIMNGQRLSHADGPGARGASAGVQPAPQELPDSATGGPLSMFRLPAPQFTVNNSVPDPGPMALSVTTTVPNPALAAGGAAAMLDPDQRLHAPALVVDLAANDGPVLASQSVDPSMTGDDAFGRGPALLAAQAGAPGAPGAADPQSALSADEKFAARIGGQEAESVTASRLRNVRTVIPQGTVIQAVLETAVDSDTPGYTRAIVSRDIRGFDQSTVLIPRGSRLIGQYRAGVAQGQSRVFVVWQRVLTPQGVSVQLASPGSDSLGRGGVGGKVNNHFFTQFGGAIMLSVLNGGMNALSNLGSASQIYIGAPIQAVGTAATQTVQQAPVQPTIKTPQGAAINVFVARDLDFSSVGRLR